MGLSLKDIGKSIASSPFINPIGYIATQNKNQKELAALKDQVNNQGSNYQPQNLSTDAPAASTDPMSVKWPTWAVVSVGVGSAIVLAVGVGLIVKAIRKRRENK